MPFWLYCSFLLAPPPSQHISVWQLFSFLSVHLVNAFPVALLLSVSSSPFSKHTVDVCQLSPFSKHTVDVCQLFSFLSAHLVNAFLSALLHDAVSSSPPSLHISVWQLFSFLSVHLVNAFLAAILHDAVSSSPLLYTFLCGSSSPFCHFT
jgi:hypothetical protein